MAMEPPPVVGLALNEFIEQLKEQNLDFCILSDYKQLPEVISGDDVDFLVLGKDHQIAAETVKRVFKKFGLTYYSLHRIKGMSSHIFHFQDDNGRFVYSLKIDIKINIELRGRIFLTSEEILDLVLPYKNFFVPSPVHQAFIGIVNTILKGKSAWEKSGSKIQDALRSNERDIENLLKRIFRENTIRFIISNMSMGRIDIIDKVRRSLFWETYFVSFFRDPFRFTSNLAAHYSTEASKLFCHPNYMIALLGPDGVGKSTLIDNIRSDVSDFLKVDFDRSKSFHIRPGLFPTITTVLKKRGHSDKRPSATYKTWQSSSFVISFIRLICFWVDYILGYLLRIMPELGSYNLVVLDRYFYDLLIDPLRYNIKLPHKLMKTLFSLLPKPKVTFVLDAPAQVIQSRKDELTKPRIASLLNKYRNLRLEYDNIHVLDATRPPEKLSNEVVSIFLEKASSRLTGRGEVKSKHEHTDTEL